jgi:hypothetical protein
MDRKALLSTVGLGSLAAAALPAALTPQAVSAAEQPADQNVLMAGLANFHFACNSKGAKVGNLQYMCTMSGQGQVSPWNVVGGGAYNFWTMPPPQPAPILAAGTWRTTGFTSFHLIGRWGVYSAGIAVMQVELVQEIPSHAVIPATLKIVCNIMPAGLVNMTGTVMEEEGYTLSGPGVSHGPYSPLTPASGITVFPLIGEPRL